MSGCTDWFVENVIVESDPSRSCVRDAWTITFGPVGTGVAVGVAVGVTVGVTLGVGVGVIDGPAVGVGVPAVIEAPIRLSAWKSGPLVPLIEPTRGVALGAGVAVGLGVGVASVLVL